jgi:hypothetical protein
MPKLAIVLAVTVALLFAGLIAWNAEATTSGAAAIGANAFSPIVNEIGCRLNGPLVGANGCRRGDAPGLQEKDWMLVRSL